LIRRVALVVKVGVVDVFVVEYLEEVSHRGSSKCGECLSTYGDDQSRVLMTQLNECREDGVRLSGSCPALVDLNLRLTFFNVVICRGEFTHPTMRAAFSLEPLSLAVRCNRAFCL